MKRFSADISSASPLSERETSISLQFLFKSRLTSFVRAKQGSPDLNPNTDYNNSWEHSKETMKNGSQLQYSYAGEGKEGSYPLKTHC